MKKTHDISEIICFYCNKKKLLCKQLYSAKKQVLVLVTFVLMIDDSKKIIKVSYTYYLIQVY